MNCKHVFVVFVVVIVTVILLSWLDNLKQPVRSVNRRGLELARPSPRESEILQLREVTLMAIIIMIIDYRRRRSRGSQRLLVPSDRSAPLLYTVNYGAYVVLSRQLLGVFPV